MCDGGNLYIKGLGISPFKVLLFLDGPIRPSLQMSSFRKVTVS